MKQFYHRFMLLCVAATAPGVLLGTILAQRADGSALVVLAVLVALGLSGSLACILARWQADWVLDGILSWFRHSVVQANGQIPAEAGLQQLPELAFLAEHHNYMMATIRELQAAQNEQTLQIEQAQRIKSDFMRGVSHHLRTPLNSVLAASHSLSNQLESLGDREGPTILLNGIHDLTQTITSLLTLAEMDSGMLNLKHQWFDLPPLIDELKQQIKRSLHQEALQIEWKVDASIPEKIHLPRELVRVVLTNLVRSPARLMTSGLVQVSLKLDGENRLRVEFQAQPLTIEAEVQQQLFQRFPDYTEQFRQQYPGLNMNLSLVRDLTRLMGGQVEIQAQPPETFGLRLLLPLDQTQLQANVPSIGSLQDYELDLAQELMQDMTEASTARRGWKILIAEDDLGNQFLFRQYLQQLSEDRYQLRFANNGKQAVEMVRQELPDLIFMDIMMPIMNGIEATTQIKNDSDSSGVPIIAITTLATGQDEDTIMRHPFDAYIKKPLMVETFYSLLNDWLPDHQAE